jgi:hypothetical protein
MFSMNYALSAGIAASIIGRMPKSKTIINMKRGKRHKYDKYDRNLWLE